MCTHNRNICKLKPYSYHNFCTLCFCHTKKCITSTNFGIDVGTTELSLAIPKFTLPKFGNF